MNSDHWAWRRSEPVSWYVVYGNLAEDAEPQAVPSCSFETPTAAQRPLNLVYDTLPKLSMVTNSVRCDS